MRKILPAAAIVAAAALAVSATASSTRDRDANQLTGTWTTSVTLVNPPPGVDATFQTFNTFVADGGVLVSSSQSHATQRSLAHGNCAHRSGRQYACTFAWFRFDPSGTFVGTQRVRRTMTLSRDGNSFRSTDTVEVIAPDGTVLASLQGTETGSRLPI